MKARQVLLGVLMCVVSTAADRTRAADAFDLQATINGTDVTNALSSRTSGSCTIYYRSVVGTYGNVVVDTNDTTSAYPARVEATDCTGDKLELLNAKISVTGTSFPEYQMIFWGTFQAPPSASNSPNGMNYRLSCNSGLVKRGAVGANTDNVKARGLLQYPAGTGTSYYIEPNGDSSLAWISKDITTANFTFFDGTRERLFSSSSGIDNDRVLQVEFNFTLKNTSDRLTLGSSSGLVLENTSGQ